MNSPRTLYDKIWDSHVVHTDKASGESLLYIDLHLIHEVTTPQAFAGLRANGRKVRRPDLTLAVADHNTPTEGQSLGMAGVKDPEAREQLETLARMNVSAAVAGLVLLAVAILMGVGWARLARVDLVRDPKMWLTVLAWLLLGFAVLAYYRLGWRGPKAVYASLAGFTTLLLSRVVTDLFVRSFHTFR